MNIKDMTATEVKMKYMGMFSPSMNLATEVVPMPSAKDMVPWGSSCKKKDTNPMNYASAGLTTISAPSDAAVQRSYLRARLDTVAYDLKQGLREQFFMDGAIPPKTIGDLIDRLKAGEYTIEYSDKPEKKIGYWSDYFSWATTPPDKDGYDKAKAELKAAKQVALDQIEIADPADGLAALQAFENFKAS